MSKYLVKILSLCAIIVCFCVSIVGAAICGTEAVACTFSVDQVDLTEANGIGCSSDVQVFVDGKLVTNKEKITVAKYTEITVKWTGTGYDFEGWKVGNSENYANTNKDGYTFEIKGNTTLHAVRDVYTYNVSYVGLLDDDTPVTIGSQIYRYGQALESVTPANGGEFEWWRLADEEGHPVDATTYDYATFPAEYISNNDKEGEAPTVVYIAPKWANLMDVTLYNAANDKVVDSKRLTSSTVETYKLPTATDEAVTDNLADGYEFDGWYDRNNQKVTDPLTFTTDGLILHMGVKEINYTVAVKFNEASEETTQVEYKVTKGEDLAYEKTRAGYTIKAATYNGNSYTYNQESKSFVGLGKAIAQQRDKQVNDVVVVWESIYGESSFNFKIEGVMKNESGALKAVYANGEQSTPVEVDNLSVIFKDVKESHDDVNKYYDLATNIYETFLSTFQHVKAKDGTNELTFKGSIVISRDGEGSDNDFTETRQDVAITFNTIMGILQDANQLGSDKIGTITISFIYE